MTIQFLQRTTGSQLAYIYTENAGQSKYPPVLFLGGYRSDMTGTKATYLEAQAGLRGQAYIRFDYSGHGQSGGRFEDGTIGAWKDDAREILERVIGRPCVLAGSSMGGWIALLLLKERPDLVKGIVGMAAAPDFTEDIYRSLSPAQQQTLMRDGVLHVENDYSDIPYSYTKQFYEEAKAHLLLRERRAIDCSLHLIQGKRDQDVPWQTALKITAQYEGPDTQAIFVEDGDHRLSRPQDLELIDAHIKALSGF